MKRIVIMGAGGFAREVAWLIRDINRASPAPVWEFAGCVISDLSKTSSRERRDDLLGDFSALETADVDAIVFGIGNPGAKLKIGAELTERFPHLEWPALIHPTVQFDRSLSRIGRGVVICAGVIGTVNLEFGDFAMVNLSCTIGHESVIGAGAVLNPTVNISGGVVIEEGVLVGTGAQILNYRRVGAHAVVGAGAVVTRDVAPGDVVTGVPARTMRPASQ